MTAPISISNLDKIDQNRLVSTTCAYCGVGCGVDISIENDSPASLIGTREHPANFGRLCVKGTHLLDTLDTENRLASPKIYTKETTWDKATSEIATKLTNIIEQHGRDAVAFYVSGQILTEDYYVANKLMKGYIGSANIDTNSRLCMSSAVAGYKRAFGEDVVPCDYNDLEQTDLLVIIGSNAAWTHPVLFQRIERAKQKNSNYKVVVIDPRETATTVDSDLHLSLKPGTDAAIFNGLLNYISESHALNEEFISNHTNNFEDALVKASQWSIGQVSKYCEVDESDLQQFYDLFISNEKVVSFYSMGINQSNSGVDKCNSIINCHLAQGKLLYTGAGPFSITGQPNAMGGREVGGLANQLTAHLDIDNPDHQNQVKAFWNSPTIADHEGAKAVEMFDKVESGDIKAIWIMATNPVVSLPNKDKIIKALETCDCVIVSDCVETDTSSYADILLPSTTWSEKNGTVTNSERTISRQRGFISPYKHSKHDWQIMCEVAQKMGFSGFDYSHPAEIFDEWAEMTSVLNKGLRQLDLSYLTGMSRKEYDQLEPSRWPSTENGFPAPVFENNEFSTDNKRANFIPVQVKLPEQMPTAEFPFIMNSGRIRDQWHTMTRTGVANALTAHKKFPFIQVNSKTASRLNIVDGEVVKAYSKTGFVLAPAMLTDDVQKHACFMPIHWNKQFASHSGVSSLYDSIVDPISGQPESKQAAIQLAKADFKYFINIFISSCIDDSKIKTILDQEFSESNEPSNPTYWAKTKNLTCYQIEIASSSQLSPQFHKKLADCLGNSWITVDKKEYRVSASLDEKQLKYVSFEYNSRKQQLNTVSSEWLTSLFESELNQEDINSILSLKTSNEYSEGPIVCSCHSVRQKTIESEIAKGSHSITELGKKLKCGTNCGSCKPELQKMVSHYDTIETVEVIN